MPEGEVTGADKGRTISGEEIVQKFIKLQARLFQEQGRTQEAYPLYEAIVYTAGMEALQGLQELRQLAMAEGDQEKAQWLTAKIKAHVRTLELGQIMGLAPEIEFSIWKKDEEALLSTLEQIAENLDESGSGTASRLYGHMGLSDGATATFLAFGKKEKEDEIFAFVKDKERLCKALNALKQEDTEEATEG